MPRLSPMSSGLLALAAGLAAQTIPAAAQVVIATPQTTTQNLDTLPNPGGLNTADVQANVQAVAGLAITGSARPWATTIESGVTISGAAGGISLLGGTGNPSVTVNAGATVYPSSGGIAVQFGDANATLSNAGTVLGVGQYIVQFGNGNNTLVNTGTINPGGTNTASVLFGNGNNTLINSGTIGASAGTRGTAIAAQFGNGNNTVILRAGSQVTGEVVGGSGTNTLILQAASVTTQTGPSIGTGQSPFINFGVLQVQNGASQIGNSFFPFGGAQFAQLTIAADSSLTIAGSSQQSSSATLTIGVTPTSAGKLAVGGTATLGGTLVVSAAPGTYAAGTKFAIVTAGGGVVGTFASTSLVTATASFGVSYLPQEVDLTVQTVGGSGLTYGNVGSAALLAGEAFTSALGAQLFATHGAPSETAGLAQGVRANYVRLAALDPVAALAQGPTSQPFTASPWSAWLSGFGVFGKVGGDATRSGLGYTTGGTAFGADYRLDPSWLVGAFAGYAGTGADASNLAGSSSGSIDSYAFGIYGSWTTGRVYVDGMLGYAYNNDQLTRTILSPGFPTAMARASTNGNQFLSSVETGRSYTLPDQFVATPFVGLQVSTLDQANFTEAGAGAFDLAVGGQSVSSVRSNLGMRLSRDIPLGESMLVNANFKLGWAHEFADAASSGSASFVGAPGSSFAVQGAQRGRDSALVGVGVAARLDARSSVYLRYDGDLDGPDNSHAVIGGVRLTW
jgi:outer membrane autotransporter protein